MWRANVRDIENGMKWAGKWMIKKDAKRDFLHMQPARMNRLACVRVYTRVCWKPYCHFWHRSVGEHLSWLCAQRCAVIYLNIFWIVFCLLNALSRPSQKRLFIYKYREHRCGTDSNFLVRRRSMQERLRNTHLTFVCIISSSSFCKPALTNWAWTRTIANAGSYTYTHVYKERMYGKHKLMLYNTESL